MENNNIIVLGTGNNGKINEFKGFLKKIQLKSSTLKNFNKIKEIKENGCSFKENSYKKAYKISKILKIPALSDDSGLIVIALKGKPGVHSSRYINSLANNTTRCKGILTELVSKKNREAFFKCVISIVLPNGVGLFYEGLCFGSISKKIIINKGFGYDPIFIHEESQTTFSKMDVKKKGIVSHRGLSIKLLLKDKKKVLSLINSWYYSIDKQHKQHL